MVTYKQEEGSAAVLVIILIILVAATYLGYKYFKINNQSSNQLTTITSPIPSTTPGTINWETYTNSSGKFSFGYPQDYQINENKVVGVDGVSIPTPNTVQVVSSVIKGTNGNFTLTVAYKSTTSSLQQFISANSSCSSVTSTGGSSYKIGSTSGLIFKDTPCGPSGATFMYFVKNGIGYIITIESTIDSNTTSVYSDEILSTFKFTETNPSSPVSSEGESCGALAGAGGNTQCAPGLTCNAGTCTK